MAAYGGIVVSLFHMPYNDLSHKASYRGIVVVLLRKPYKDLSHMLAYRGIVIALLQKPYKYLSQRKFMEALDALFCKSYKNVSQEAAYEGFLYIYTPGQTYKPKLSTFMRAVLVSTSRWLHHLPSIKCKALMEIVGAWCWCIP